MTAPLVSSLSRVQPSTAWSGYSSPRRSSTHVCVRLSKQTRTNSLESGSAFGSPSLNGLLITLVESMQDGVLIVAQNLLPIYTNTRAKELCQQLLVPDEEARVSFPGVIGEACHRLLKDGLVDDEVLVVEYQGHQGQTIRVRVRWLSLPAEKGAEKEAYILVQLENRQKKLEEDLQVDRQKYDLTEREAEIWMLLRQEHTYQEIAERLQISLNTVKTHVKNVYAKRRSSPAEKRVWYSR